tara:strand:- start:10270 stop:11457 length:1188 start_codon:yes stop_codon:yes gene_type:complete
MYKIIIYILIIIILILLNIIIRKTFLKTKFTKKKSSLNNWMENILNNFPHMKLKDLILVGTHDSASGNLNSSSYIYEDGVNISYKTFIDFTNIKGFLKYLLKLIWFIVKEYIVDFTKTQNLTLIDQLNNGVRLFDLRMAYYSDNIIFHHGGIPIEYKFKKFINYLNEFIKNNNKEVIILKLSHYKISNKDKSITIDEFKNKISKYLINIFNDKIIKNNIEGNPLEINNLLDMKYKDLIKIGNIIIIMRNYSNDYIYNENNVFVSPYLSCSDKCNCDINSGTIYPINNNMLENNYINCFNKNIPNKYLNLQLHIQYNINNIINYIKNNLLFGLILYSNINLLEIEKNKKINLNTIKYLNTKNKKQIFFNSLTIDNYIPEDMKKILIDYNITRLTNN